MVDARDPRSASWARKAATVAGLAGRALTPLPSLVSLDYAAWRPERLRSLVVAASTGQFSEVRFRESSPRVWRPIRITTQASPCPDTRRRIRAAMVGDR
jgi:hypothetical protein